MEIVFYVLSAVNTVLVAILVARSFRTKEQDFRFEFQTIEKAQQRFEGILRDEVAKNREELARNINASNDSFLKRMTDVATLQKNQLDSFSRQLTSLIQLNEQKGEKLREVVEQKLALIQADNTKQLDRMRETVDEKLHSTLEKRLGESFRVVSDRLEKVHQGLGEMQHLASGVGDLKKVLSNVKTRGTLGEIQLENLLDELLTRDQYEKNVVTKKNSRDAVEFAIKLPQGYVPIDSKFPIEDFQRIIDAQNNADLAAVEEAGKALESRIKLEGRRIRDKYIEPPNTMDFAIMFLPFEGLYAEVIRRSGLFEFVRREFKVIIAGPHNLHAILFGFQFGFRTLAIEKHASEVWRLLGSVKSEFNKFGDILDKTHKKLQEASNTIETAARKSRTIERQLKNVQDQELPAESPVELVEHQI